MPAELDPFIARLLARPEWLPTWTTGPWAAIADAGEPAHRKALDRWNAVRDGDDTRAYAAVAVVLAECFDDERALLGLAERIDRAEMMEAVLPFARIMTPRGRCARTLERLFLSRLLHEVGEASLRDDLVAALEHLEVDDGSDVYLPMRRALVRDLAGTPLESAAERYADRLLVTACRAAPDRDDVRQTVLSYWGQAAPLDSVPTAEHAPDEAPASWLATCALIGRLRRAEHAEQLIALAHDTDFWREGRAGDAEAYVDALERSTASDAEDRLLEIAKADVPASGRAVSAIARRRTRMAEAPTIVAPRIEAVTSELIAAGALSAAPGPRGAALLDETARTSDTTLDLAARVLEASGRAVAFDLDAGSQPLAAHVRGALEAVTLAVGERRFGYVIDDHEDAGVEVRRELTGERAVFAGDRMGAGALDALVPDGADEGGRELRRIRIDPEHVTYAMLKPDAWSAYLDWAATSPLPEPSPVPARRAAPASSGPALGGFLGRLLGR